MCVFNNRALNKKQKYDFVELKPKKKNVYEKESNFKYFLITLEGDIVVLCIKI